MLLVRATQNASQHWRGNITRLDATRLAISWHKFKMPSDNSIALQPSGRKAGAFTIGAIFAGESLLRALNVSVIPIQAYELLGSSQKVSIVATSVSFLVLLMTLSLPFLLRGVRRRWVYTLGIVLIMASAFIFAANLVAGHYNERWEIELGFREIKQNLLK